MSLELFEQLKSGDRAALAKAITLVESRSPGHQIQAEKLVQLAMQEPADSLRIGITGVPGVGKSTFINSFGSRLVTRYQRRVCVLAVDPSSLIHSGSILGDKTRMDTLAALENVFIRPTPTGGHMGGIARKTGETILLCEAAGYDTVLVETVGVGQNEYFADNVVDTLLLLLLPDAGDELQGIKRGIMELADMVIVNKADIAEPGILQRSLNDLGNALKYLTPKTPGLTTPVLQHSLNNPEEEDRILTKLMQLIEARKSSGSFAAKRTAQQMEWFKEALRSNLLDSVLNNAQAQNYMEQAYPNWQKGSTTQQEILNSLITLWRKG